MDQTNSKNQGSALKIISGIFVIINLIVAIWAYPKLPELVPSHWNAAGEVDGYSGPFSGAFLFPLIILGIYLMFWIIPRIDPKRANYLKMGRVFWIVGAVLIVFLSAMYWGTIAVALGYLDTLPRWYFSGIGVIFIILGNYFGKIKFNYTFGIRTPWTLANEEVWVKTHRFAGPIWVLGGILMCLVGFVPAAWFFPVFMVVICGISILPVAYSYILFRKVAG